MSKNPKVGRVEFYRERHAAETQLTFGILRVLHALSYFTVKPKLERVVFHRVTGGELRAFKR
jgi:hypothetical protein